MTGGGVIHANIYEASLPAVRRLLNGKTEAERMELLSLVAIATSVPIIPLAVFVGEMYDYTPDLITLIHRLMLFYNIQTVFIDDGRIDYHENHKRR